MEQVKEYYTEKEQKVDESVSHENMIYDAKKFFERCLVILNERGQKHGNISDLKYHIGGLGVKEYRARAGRRDFDTLGDAANYAFLAWYFGGKRE
jgi:hypothetical protein